MPMSLRELWEQAHAYEMAGNLEAASTVYRRIVGIDTDQPFAWLRLSQMARREGAFRDALSYCLQAATAVTRTKRATVLSQVTQCLLHYDERELVTRLISQAQWTDPVVLQQSAVLAQHLSLADAHQLSLSLSEHALRFAPANHLLHFLRGNALRYLGQLENATEAYEASIRAAPSFADAHWALSSHEPSRVDIGRTERIARELESDRQPPIARAMLNYALFREYDSMSRIPEAWDSLMRGAGLMKSLQGANGFSRDFIQPLSDVMNRLTKLEAGTTRRSGVAEADAPTPVFIVGMPRTGTTLVERILSNHSLIETLGESNALRMAVNYVSDSFLPDDYSLDQNSKIDYAKVAVEYAKRAKGQKREVVLLDKNPMNIILADVIIAGTPNAKMICLRRGRNDTVFSNVREIFPGGGYEYSYDISEAVSYTEKMHELMEYVSEQWPGRCLVVDYEELVVEPERNSLKITEFIGIPHEPGLTDIQANSRPSSTASSTQIRDPINTKGVGSWLRYREFLTPFLEVSTRDRF